MASTDALADVARLKVDVRHPNHWSKIISSSSAQSAVEMIGVPGAGKHLVLTDVAISSLTAQTTQLFETTTGIYGIIYTGTNGNHVSNLVTPIPLGTNEALNVTTTAGIAHSIFVSGYTEVD